MTAGTYFSATRRRWLAAMCACVWLLSTLAIAFAPLPVHAQADLPPWAGDICSQSHAAPQAPSPDPSPCQHALCCLLGCAAHHGAPVPPFAATPPRQDTAQPIRLAPVEPARLPVSRLLLADPRGPPSTAA